MVIFEHCLVMLAAIFHLGHGEKLSVTIHEDMSTDNCTDTLLALEVIDCSS